MTTWDEHGRSKIQVADALGRVSMQTAAAPTSTDATFTYGPFDVLLQETTSDGSGQTDIDYDVLGRRISLSRTGAGLRRTVYNAFGDVVETNRDRAPGVPARVTFGRDGLGRMTSAQGPDGNYFYTWDAPASSPTAPAPYAMGKLVDATDGNYTQVHFDYGANGLVSQKTWSTPAADGGVVAITPAQFAYDMQGRLSNVIYPTYYGWYAPLSLTYAYDPYDGQEASVTDTTNPSAPTTVWLATARNDRGLVSSETMKASETPFTPVTRVTNYNLQDGSLKDAALIGSNGQSQVSYTYDESGAPVTLGMSGVGGTWTSSFSHDNLGRLASWRGTGAGPLITYTYDGDGNLNRRSWSGEDVIYGSIANARTVTVVRGGRTVSNDAYKTDIWGRVVDTPTATLEYDSFDQVKWLTEKSTGRVDFFRRDAIGEKLLTGYGNPFDGQVYTLLYTFGDLWEFSTSTNGDVEERCRVRVGGRLVGELVRTDPLSWQRTATFYLTDNVASVVAESSSLGTVAARARRDPFGNMIADAASPYLPSEPTAADPDGTGRMGFGDHARDALWGLTDMVTRFYSPRLGRFISPDRILPDPSDRTQHNAFAYVRNAPATRIDPLGTCDSIDPDTCMTLPPITPITPPTGPGGGEGQGGEKQDPPPPCDQAHNCVTKGPEPPPKMADPPPIPVVSRLTGSPVAGATSSNAARATTIDRGLGTLACGDAGSPPAPNEWDWIDGGPMTSYLFDPKFNFLGDDGFPEDVSPYPVRSRWDRIDKELWGRRGLSGALRDDMHDVTSTKTIDAVTQGLVGVGIKNTGVSATVTQGLSAVGFSLDWFKFNLGVTFTPNHEPNYNSETKGGPVYVPPGCASDPLCVFVVTHR